MITGCSASALEAVDFREQLVQRLLPLVVPADQADRASPALSDRVDLVDEHDGRSRRSCLLEQIADARRTDTHEHLHELRTAGLEEPDAGLPCGGLRNERLPRPGRPDEEDALWNASTEPRELFGRLEKLDDLLKFRDRFVGAADVLECDAHLLRLHFRRLALADTEDASGRPR